MSTKDEALKLALEALDVATTPLARDRQEVLRAQAAIREALAEQPAQRCPLCDYQHGHAIGCENNPVDIALNKMAENERELGLDYMEPAPATELRKQQEPVAIDRLYIEALIEGLYQNEDPVSIDAAEEFERLLKTPASPPASKPWVGLTDEERLAVVHYSQLDNAKAIEAKLKEKNA